MFSASSDSGSTRISAWMLSAFPSRRIVVPWTSGSRAHLRRESARVGGERGDVARERADEDRDRARLALPGAGDLRRENVVPGHDRRRPRHLLERAVVGLERDRRQREHDQEARRRAEPEQRPAHDPADPARPRTRRAGRGRAVRLRRMRPRSTRRPSRCRSAGSRVDDARTATVTTIIAPAAIDWTARTGTSHSASSARTTVRPEKTTAVPDVRIAVSTASSGVGSGLELLAEPGEHEHRVVDGDADPDHRDHRRHEDRHLGRRRDEEDRAERDDDRDDRERERQHRGDERPEERDEDDRDERRGQRLGAREVVLDDLAGMRRRARGAEDVDPRRAVGHLDPVGQPAADRERLVLRDRRVAGDRAGAPVRRGVGAVVKRMRPSTASASRRTAASRAAAASAVGAETRSVNGWAPYRGRCSK